MSLDRVKAKIPRIIKVTARFILNWLSDISNRLLSDQKGYRRLLQWTQEMPVSNGSRYFQTADIRVGVVADSFVWQNYSPTCQLIALTPDNWKTQLQKIDCILVTSAWRGLNQEWVGLGTHGNAIRTELLALMRQAKSDGLPVLFYSKEDPPNFHCFAEFAQEADYVFTSAEECIPRYQECCPNAIVNALPFAVNPLIHNPIGSARPKWEGTVFFAGSWMAKYPERTEKMKKIFGWIQKTGMEVRIADRNFARRDFRYQYPFRYLKYVVGSFDYKQIAVLYKIFPFCLNFNSVTNSNTMFAMRVYDALASGARVLSNDSLGVRRLFPEVHIIDTYDDFAAAVTMSDAECTKEKLSGIRRVFQEGTVFEKMAQMLQTAGIENNFQRFRPVAVILSPDIPDADRDRYVQMFSAQSYPNKKLFYGWQEISNAGHFDMVTVWGPNRSYGAFYLEDMINGFKYTDCDYVTKYAAAGDISQRQYEFTDRILDLYATVFWRTSVTMNQLENFGEEEILIPNGFISDAFHYDII